MEILVTGAGGYIGSIATDLFLSKGYQVVALDNFSRGYKAPLNYLQKKYGSDKLTIYEKDLSTDNLDDLFSEHKIDAVVHYAAFCSVDESVKFPERYEKNNVEGSRRLIVAMTQAGIKKIVFSSTCAVYGEVQTMPVSEEHSTIPVNPYGQSKLKIEEEIKSTGLSYIILRYFNVCGASDDGTLGDSKKPSVHLVQNAVRGALGLEPFFLTCPSVDTPDGTPIRDYISVVDLNEAHLLSLEYLTAGGQSQIINLGTGSGNSVLEIVKKVEAITKTTLPKEKGPARQGEYARMVADIAKAKQILNWEPHRDLEHSIQSLVTWYNRCPEGWEN